MREEIVGEKSGRVTYIDENKIDFKNLCLFASRRDKITSL